MVELINSDPLVLDALVTCDKSWIYCYDPESKRQSSQWKHAGSPRPKKARQSKSTHKLLKEAVAKVIDTLTQEDFHGAFQKLLERYKCIAAGGDYFEGD